MERVDRIQKIQNVGEGIVHSVSMKSFVQGRGLCFTTTCGKPLLDCEANKDRYMANMPRRNAYEPTQRPITCKACLRTIEKDEEITMSKITFLRNIETGVVHYIDPDYPAFTSQQPTHTTLCGAELRGEKYEKGVRIRPFRLCKVCKDVYDRDYGEKQTIGEKSQSNPHTGDQYYIAEEVEPGEIYVAPSLKDLLIKLKEKWAGDGEELVTLLEEGEFIFYKATKIDIQTKVEVIKEVIELSEC